MRKIILGLVAATAVAAPVALAAAPANAEVVSSDPSCTPVKAASAWTETLYKYSPVKSSDGPTQWDTVYAPADTHKTYVVKGKNVDYTRDGNKTSTVSHAAVEGVTCSVSLAEHFAGEGTDSVVVPFVKGVDTFLYGVQGYDEKVAITQDVTVTKAMAGQFWIGYEAQEGYVIANPHTAQWHIDFASVTAPATQPEVKFSNPDGTHIDLPDVFDIQHAESNGTYWSTQISVKVTNDTATDQEFRVRYADVQDGGRVWVERAVFTDGVPANVVKAGDSRIMTFDVWYDAVSDSSDVPDDLTLDFGFELA